MLIEGVYVARATGQGNGRAGCDSNVLSYLYWNTVRFIHGTIFSYSSKAFQILGLLSQPLLPFSRKRSCLFLRVYFAVPGIACILTFHSLGWHNNVSQMDRVQGSSHQRHSRCHPAVFVYQEECVHCIYLYRHGVGILYRPNSSILTLRFQIECFCFLAEVSESYMGYSSDNS